MKKRFAEEQIIPILKAADFAAKALCRKCKISGANFDAWREKYGGFPKLLQSRQN